MEIKRKRWSSVKNNNTLVGKGIRRTSAEPGRGTDVQRDAPDLFSVVTGLGRRSPDLSCVSCTIVGLNIWTVEDFSHLFNFICDTPCVCKLRCELYPF